MRLQRILGVCWGKVGFISHCLQGLDVATMEVFILKEVEAMSSNTTTEPEVDKA